MKIYYWLKYRVWHSIRYDVPNFFRNLYLFRKTLWRYRQWDWSGLYQAMYDSLKGMEEQQRVYGHSVNSHKYAKDIRICLKLLERLIEDDYGTRGYDYVEGDRGTILSGKFVSKYSEQPEWKHGWKLRVAQQNYERELLFKLMAKHSQGWWD